MKACITYNPEGSKLRNDQLELVEMLQFFDGICKENNIQWWLSSGTLLGAARHKGFIPWDDDIDIVLLRKDYLRLQSILKAMKNEEYVFHCQKTDIEYVNYFGKFRKKKGRVESSSKRYNYYKWAGIGFDIFSIEKTNYLSAKIADLIYGRLSAVTIDMENSHLRRFSIRFFTIVCDWVVFPLLRLFGRINPGDEYHYSLGIGWPKHTFFLSDTLPLSTCEFEGVMFPAPKNIDAYLTRVYGDWKVLPSEEQIKKSIHCKQYRKEIFGDE